MAKKTKDDYADELLDLQLAMQTGTMRLGDVKRAKYLRGKIKTFVEDEQRERMHFLTDKVDNGLHSKEDVEELTRLRGILYF